MISNRPYLNGVLGFLLVTSAPFLFAASNPVQVESVGSGSPVAPFQAPIEETPAEDMRGIETQYQLQLLQQEVQELRGLVEELSYELKRTRTTQDDRYLELDSRVQGIQNQLSGMPTEPVHGGAAVERPGTATPTRPAETSVSGNEKELYETALELIRGRQYDLAITQLQAVIGQYPEGDFTANAYYWMGEVYAAKPEPEYEQARQALSQVITFFPDNRKMPDAAFKLGKVYHLMGDCGRAREILEQVIQDQQGKSVAKLAEAYLRDKLDC